MSLGTKNRQRQNADLCKQHLRDGHPGQKELVEEFIREIEGPEMEPDAEPDITPWSQFADTRRIPAEMLQRVEERFTQWLRGG